MRISKWLLLSVIVPVLGAALTVAQTTPTLRDGFVKYAGVSAVTGREGAFVAFLKSQLPPGVKSEVDNMGNLTVQLGDASPQLLIVTSVDEPGFLVTDITDEGFLRVAAAGARTTSTLFTQFHEGHYVDIAARSGVIRGVVALPSSHLVRGHRDYLVPDRLLIDIGARTRQEAQSRGIELLEPVTAVKDIALLAENRIAGPMLSRKFGAFALMQVLKAAGPKGGKGVVFAWATQSAMSNSGVARLARRFSPKQVLVLGSYQRGTGRGGQDPIEILDSGVLIPDANSPGTASPLLRGAAASAGSKIKLTPSTTGTLPEVRAFGTNVDVCALAIAVAYSGSLVETIDLDDLQQLIEFINMVIGKSTESSQAETS